VVKKKRRRCRRWGGEDGVPVVVGGCFRRWAGVDGWDEQVVQESQGYSLMRPLMNLLSNQIARQKLQSVDGTGSFDRVPDLSCALSCEGQQAAELL